jgi:hypothetical protein
MNKYAVKTGHCEWDHVQAELFRINPNGTLEFYKDTSFELYMAYAPGAWQIVHERMPDETIPSDSPKEAPQG